MKQFLSKAVNLVGKLGDAGPAAAPAGLQHQETGQPHKKDPVLEHLLRDFRSATLRKHFFANPSKDYTETLDVKVLAGTYNVAGKRPPPGLTLNDWLDQWKDCWPADAGSKPPGAGAAAAAAAAAGAGAGGGGSRAAPGGPDLVVVGFQEVVPLSAGNVIAGPSSEGADAWDFTLATTLNGDEWAGRNFGRTFGSSIASQAMMLNLERLGSQAAYAYSVISSQAATVVGAMDKMWSGGPNGPNGSQLQQGSGAAGALGAEQQQARLELALASREDDDDVYVQVVCKQLVGVYLSVWARKRLAKHIRGVQATSAATGFGGYLGNKGAVAVRLRVYDAPLVVVCSHLASGDAEGDEARRNADVADIMRRCSFAADADAVDPAAAAGRQQPGGSAAANWGAWSSLAHHANLIWLGDLNYRLTCGDDEARRCIRAGKLDVLLQHDQLGREMAAGRVFHGWREGPICFNPTYKYHLGCNIYSGEPLPPGLAAVRAVDSSASLADSDATGDGDGAAGGAACRDSPSVEKQKKRTPAWCDRVLWLPGGQLFQLAYGRGELAVSDHRPVAAAFLLEAHRYRRDAIQQLAEAARRAVDMSDNASRPRCNLSPNFLELGLVPFGLPRTVALQLSNTGASPARFYFVPPPKPRQSMDGGMAWDDDQPLCPPWLQIQPTEGEVPPGATATIQLTAVITGGGPGSAAAFIAANPPPPPAPINTLDTILILRLEDGADAFVSLAGAALPSCFGMDLEALMSLGPAPVLAVEALEEAGQQLLQQGLQQPAQLAQAEAGAEGGGGGGGLASDGVLPSTGLEQRVPKEVQRLVSFLQAQQRLHTPGLFSSSVRICSGGSGSGGSGRQQQLQQLLAATAPVRWALDTGLDFPAHVTAHQAAAALLLLLQQLPDSFMPLDLTAILVHCVPAAASSSQLLSDAMSVTEWATLRHVLALFKAALAPAAAADNGLGVCGLAATLAEFLFGATGGSVPTELAANRVAFVMTLLDPVGSASGQQQQQAAAGAAGEDAARALAASAVYCGHSQQQQQQQNDMWRGSMVAAAAGRGSLHHQEDDSLI